MSKTKILASKTRNPDGTGFHPDGWMDGCVRFQN